MLNRRKKKIDLHPCTLFDETTFYTAFKKDLTATQESIIIESPFMTVKRSNDLAKLLKKAAKRGVKVRINTRQPEHHPPHLSDQAWKAVNILKKTGAEVDAYDNMLHRKLAIIDNEIIYDGSLNILSQSKSKELMRRTVSKDYARQIMKFTKPKK